MTPPDAARYLGQGNQTPNSRREIARRWLWAVVQATFFRCSPRGLHRFRVGLLRLFGAQVASDLRVYPTARIIYPWKLSCEGRVLIGPGVNIYNLANVTLRYGAQLSQGVHLCAGTHDFLQWSMPLVTRPIAIGRNVWLGAEVFVGPGVNIGDLAVVGARSVVVRDLPACMICVGHPCRPVKARAEPT